MSAIPRLLRPLISHVSAHQGAIISSRDSPSLQSNLFIAPEEPEDCLNVGSDRMLRSQTRPRRFKRYKAMMKQVVSGAFTGFFEPSLEDEVVRLLVHHSHPRHEETDGLDITDQEASLGRSADVLLKAVKTLIAPRLAIYLDSIVKKLVDPVIALRWDKKSNNCQTFCDTLIDTRRFGRLIHSSDGPRQPQSKEPLYAMSFVCRPSAYAPPRVETKLDVPNGLTEEYLLQFRYGYHLDSDILDYMAEYWHDWGGFGTHLYNYQDLFPWDCTEAYTQSSGRCGDCNMAKHVWAFPFDSFSAVQMHPLAVARALPRTHVRPQVDAEPTQSPRRAR